MDGRTWRRPQLSCRVTGPSIRAGGRELRMRQGRNLEVGGGDELEAGGEAGGAGGAGDHDAGVLEGLAQGLQHALGELGQLVRDSIPGYGEKACFGAVGVRRCIVPGVLARRTIPPRVSSPPRYGAVPWNKRAIEPAAIPKSHYGGCRLIHRKAPNATIVITIMAAAKNMGAAGLP